MCKPLEHLNTVIFRSPLRHFTRISQFLESSPKRLLEGVRPPDPERTARINKAFASNRLPRKTG
jgi:hypothetical protein